MIKVTEAVSDLLFSSPIALEAMRAGVLNLTAFSRQIHAQVEQKTRKPVKLSTIVVALSRIEKKLEMVPPLSPKIWLEEMNIKSGLVDITYPKTEQNLSLMRSLPKDIARAGFLTTTEGMSELTIIVSDEEQQKIFGHFSDQPKIVLPNLVGVSLKFSEEFLAQPNVIFGILAILATKRIDITEIVSTFTELTVVVKKEDLEAVVNSFQDLFE